MVKSEIPDDFEEHEDRIECWNCGGGGRVAGCFEDTCSCTGDPDDPDECCAPSRCDVCRGLGWFPPPAPLTGGRSDAD